MAILLHIFKYPIDMFVTDQLPSEQDLTAVISYLNLFFRTPNICSSKTRDRMCALLYCCSGTVAGFLMGVMRNGSRG